MTDLHTLLKDNADMMNYWKYEVATQQQQLYNAYIRIKELTEELNYIKKQASNTQLEFDFNANI
tara:strand:+ start:634 stop:825 length:192 start_codon:yes stop_codon:yes gene_type:complete